jgi:hypothetical protein
MYRLEHRQGITTPPRGGCERASEHLFALNARTRQKREEAFHLSSSFISRAESESTRKNRKYDLMKERTKMRGC